MKDGFTGEDRQMLQTVLMKRNLSLPLSPAEEKFAKTVFEQMISSKNMLNKTVRMITGESLRKTAETPIREDDRYKQRKADEIEGDVPNPNYEELETKIPDVDEKETKVTNEEERLGEKVQADIPSHQSATVKFTPADPIQVGDWVAKNFAREGQLIMTGQVHSVGTDNGIAMVKWADGRITGEPAHLLVKATNGQADKDKTQAEQTVEDEEVSPPVKKRK